MNETESFLLALQNNINELIEDAELLLKNNRKKRSLFLYITAMEESVKLISFIKNKDTKFPTNHHKKLLNYNEAIQSMASYVSSEFKNVNNPEAAKAIMYFLDLLLKKYVETGKVTQEQADLVNKLIEEDTVRKNEILKSFATETELDKILSKQILVRNSAETRFFCLYIDYGKDTQRLSENSMNDMIQSFQNYLKDLKQNFKF